MQRISPVADPHALLGGSREGNRAQCLLFLFPILGSCNGVIALCLHAAHASFDMLCCWFACQGSSGVRGIYAAKHGPERICFGKPASCQPAHCLLCITTHRTVLTCYSVYRAAKEVLGMGVVGKCKPPNLGMSDMSSVKRGG